MIRSAFGLLLAFSLLAGDPAAAQIRGGDTFLGIQGGATSSEIRGATINTNFRWGGTAGVLAGWRPSPGTVTGLEANWVMKGGEGTSLHYIEIPFTAGVSGPLGGNGWRGRFYTGIGFGFKVGCSSDAPSEFRDCDNVNGTEWSWPFGIQIGKWNVNRSLVALDVRYTWGLSRVFNNISGENRVWQFKLVWGRTRR